MCGPVGRLLVVVKKISIGNLLIFVYFFFFSFFRFLFTKLLLLYFCFFLEITFCKFGMFVVKSKNLQRSGIVVLVCGEIKKV